ncbi:phage/plasmid primase, P4 family [Mesorhizobium sp. M0037]|uniref:DNA primase family protein n=1 Tax=unclassified Mesorhizobium TaxID=325217 RepID=UPI00333689BE
MSAVEQYIKNSRALGYADTASIAALIEAGFERVTIDAALIRVNMNGHAHEMPGDISVAAQQAAQRAAAEEAARIVLNRAAPMESAREFVKRQCTAGSAITLKYWRRIFYFWNGSYYKLVDDKSVRQAIWEFLDSAKVKEIDKQTGVTVYSPFNPTSNAVDNVVDALTALVGVNAAIAAPAWLTATSPVTEGRDYIPFKNGLYHHSTSTCLACNPHFFNTGATDVHFDAADTGCPNWMAFVREVWPDDQQSIDTLQEIMGYLLTSDTSMQKIFMFNGPGRAGKGTILRMIGHLCGASNVEALSLDMLAQPFGMEELLDATVAVVGDAKISKHTDSGVIAERLKGVSGEDVVPVQRKYKGKVTAKLNTRFVISSNGLLGITDNSGVLPSRIIMMRFKISFLGREERTLFDLKLRPEATGVLNWALTGLRRLMARGNFIQPETSKDSIETMQLLGSPEINFVNEFCHRGGTALEVRKDELYAAWHRWCLQNNWKPGTKEMFSKNLLSAFSGQIDKARIKDVEESAKQGKLVQYQAYLGIALNDDQISARRTEFPLIQTAK